MNNPLVSIIIPVYNAERYIAESIQSALDQTWTNIEVIVVNDGSTDGSLEIVKSFGGNNKVRILSQNNKGAGAARNTGLRNCKGDFIQFLDADDLLAQDKIENQLKILRYNDECVSSCKWLSFESSILEAISPKKTLYRDYESLDFLVESLNGRGMMPQSCWLTPKILIERAGPWDETLSLHDDGEFFCRVLLQSKFIKFSDTSVSYYRRHGGPSLSKSRDERAVLSNLKVCDSYRNNILSRERSNRTVNAVVAQYISLAYVLFDQNPKIANEAIERVHAMGIENFEIQGGALFRRLAGILGFANTLKLRSFFRRHLNLPMK